MAARCISIALAIRLRVSSIVRSPPGCRQPVALQFRTEAFNIAKHSLFGNPNTVFGNANFGTITQLAGGYTPRQIQFALKLLF